MALALPVRELKNFDVLSMRPMWARNGVAGLRLNPSCLVDVAGERRSHHYTDGLLQAKPSDIAKICGEIIADREGR